MLTIRTDLAVEAHALWRQKAGETAALSGVSAGESLCRGLPVTHVEILDEEGANVLGKPRGRYCTLDVSALWRRKEDAPAAVPWRWQSCWRLCCRKKGRSWRRGWETGP